MRINNYKKWIESRAKYFLEFQKQTLLPSTMTFFIKTHTPPQVKRLTPVGTGEVIVPGNNCL